MDPFEATVSAVMQQVTREGLLETVAGMIERPSPTGAERPLAEWVADHLATGRLRSHRQVIDAHQANAVAVLPGAANGPTTLLYAPIDTFTTGDERYDVPGAATAMRADMEPRATVDGDLVQGLGAGNPKGHAACVLTALSALDRAGVEPRGDVVAAFGAGGMPAFAVDGIGTEGRANTGHGVGAGFLLERGFSTDAAIIAKPGWHVSHEEVGLVWLDVRVPGVHTYVGSRHRMPYRNAVVAAGVVAQRLEEWLEHYAERHEHSTMRPQGIVSSVTGGLPHLAAATPAEVRLRLDLRLTTRQTPAQVTREVRAFLDELGRELDLEVTVTQTAAIPASFTDPASAVVRAGVTAWEAVAGVAHQPNRHNSGATDANVLRMHGVPTARLGMAKVPRGIGGAEVDFTLGMNLVDVREMRRLVEILVRAVLLLQGRGGEEELR